MKDYFWTERSIAMAELMALLIQMHQECGMIEDYPLPEPK